MISHICISGGTSSRSHRPSFFLVGFGTPDSEARIADFHGYLAAHVPDRVQHANRLL